MFLLLPSRSTHFLVGVGLFPIVNCGPSHLVKCHLQYVLVSCSTATLHTLPSCWPPHLTSLAGSGTPEHEIAAPPTLHVARLQCTRHSDSEH